MIKKEGILFVISAPSGAGKTTLVKRLLKAFPDLGYSISYTTRPPRTGEKDKKAYFFVSEKVFRKMIAKQEFIEYAEVYNHLYGTSLKYIKNELKIGKDVLLDLDTQGARQITKKIKTVSVFLLPPSLGELKRRLRKRNSDEEITINNRFCQVKAEIACIKIYDYIVINDKLEDAFKELKSIVIAERCKRKKRENIVSTFLL